MLLCDVCVCSTCTRFELELTVEFIVKVQPCNAHLRLSVPPRPIVCIPKKHRRLRIVLEAIEQKIPAGNLPHLGSVEFATLCRFHGPSCLSQPLHAILHLSVFICSLFGSPLFTNRPSLFIVLLLRLRTPACPIVSPLFLFLLFCIGGSGSTSCLPLVIVF